MLFLCFLITKLDLKPDVKILDIGSGIGLYAGMLHNWEKYLYHSREIIK
jgi:cyclopropane fatty-acyl-phospholipid synthase-like methyltransferase